MTSRVGIDVGGTFTDLLLLRADGSVGREKLFSTPPDFSKGVMDGLANLARSEGLEFPDFVASLSLIVHGTTVATNTLLTGTGARTGLLTTRGFRDALAMRRGVKERIYDNKYPPPPALVDRHLRRPVTERTLYDGMLECELNENDVQEACKVFTQHKVKAVAICFLNSYANGRTEELARRTVESMMPDVFVTASHELLPRVGFYDRVSTTVLNACTGPVMEGYLRALFARLNDGGFTGSLLVMLSSGGVAAVHVAARMPAAAIRSGPAGAAIAVTRYGSNHPRSVTFDMGGTSLDTAMVLDGQVGRVQSAEFNRYRIALPMVDLLSIGAGGGSIAWLDGAGLLRVGPVSAGADPGPACYGRGGTEPTVTDADLMLGYINPSGLLGGRVPLDIGAAEKVLDARVAQQLGMTVVEAARAVYDVVNVNMAAAVREFLHERGHDPKDFTLVAGGGAGPVHAVAVAQDLGMARVLIPRDSAILSAVGLLHADLRHDFVQTSFSFLDSLDAAELRHTYGQLIDQGRMTLQTEGVPASQHEFIYSADLRYERQVNELEVFIEWEALERGAFEAIASSFHQRHEELYGYHVPDSRIEFVNARVSAVGKTPFLTLPGPGARKLPAPIGRRAVVDPEGNPTLVDVYSADDLGVGARIKGFAIVEGASLSVVVPGGYSCDVNTDGDLVLARTSYGP